MLQRGYIYMLQTELAQPIKVNVVTSDAIIALVKDRIRSTLTTNGHLQVVLDYVQDTQGKMIRPTLVALVYQLCDGQDEEKLIDIATGIELVHLASLVHDDIVDESSLRRGTETIQKHYSPAVAVLTGDYLFSQAFLLFCQRDANDVLALMTQAICKMASGEVEQLLSPGTDETYYWHYIYQKTACLLGAACRAGALVAGCNPLECDDLEQFGINLGYAYQLIDDVLDYSQNSMQTGKSCGVDYQQGMWTLPVIRAVASNIVPRDWHQTLKFNEMKTLLTNSGILSDIVIEAQQHLHSAEQILEKFADCQAKKQLQHLSHFMGNRKH